MKIAVESERGLVGGGEKEGGRETERQGKREEEGDRNGERML